MSEGTMERWHYAGRRQPAKGAKALHAWLDSQDKVLHYGVGAGVIGGAYDVEVWREDDSVRAGVARATYAGEKHDDQDLVARWELADLTTRQVLAAGAAERRHAKDTSLERNLAGVRRLAAQCRTQDELAALQELVRRETSRAWWSR